MPLYEYKCGKCGEIFELLRKREEANKYARCPACGARTRKRIISACAIRGSFSGMIDHDATISEKDIPKPPSKAIV